MSGVAVLVGTRASRADTTPACSSRASQSFWGDAGSTHRPPQAAHSWTVVAPSRSACSGSEHRGQSSGAASSIASRVASAPQRAQNRLPTNIGAKHDGQVTVASAAPQYSQRADSAEAGAPQPGQRSEESGKAVREMDWFFRLPIGLIY